MERRNLGYRVVMTAFTSTNPALVRDIRQQLARLELVSHAPSGGYGGPSRKSSNESIGGRRPGADDREFVSSMTADERAAYEESHYKRTVAYFHGRVGRARTENDLRRILREIESAVTAWRIMPIPEGQPPDMGSPQWKRWISESPEGAGELARLFGVSRQYIYRVRNQYGSSSSIPRKDGDRPPAPPKEGQ